MLECSVFGWCETDWGVWGWQCTLTGMVTGSGQQSKAVWIVLVSYWVVGVPVALLLGFKTSLAVCTHHLGIAPCLLRASSLLRRY